MRAPIRLVRGGWPPFVDRALARFVRADPAALIDPDASAEAFRQAISNLYVGDTIKITESNRHPDADALLLDNVDLAGRVMVDIGASDGTTSAELIARLPQLGSYVIADLYLTVDIVEHGRHLVIYDPSGECVLIAGRRLVAWPALSRTVRTLYRPLFARARRRGDRRQVLLLNPAVRSLMARDPRVTHRVHDVFTVWTGPRPDVVKIANLLRRLYFGDDDIVRALTAVHASLADTGHLLVVDNPRIAGIVARGGLYQRTDSGFRAVARTDEAPEIDDLITGLNVPNEQTSTSGASQ